MTSGCCFESIPIRLCIIFDGVVDIARVEAYDNLIVRLEAFAVDDGGSRFVVFLFADPHLLEGGQ